MDKEEGVWSQTSGHVLSQRAVVLVFHTVEIVMHHYLLSISYVWVDEKYGVGLWQFLYPQVCEGSQ